MKPETLIGKCVVITTRDSWEYKNWGIVKAWDGEMFHVAMNNGDTQLVFYRDEFKVNKVSRINSTST